MSSYTITRESVVSEADVIKAGQDLVADGKPVTGNRLRRVLGERGTPTKLMEVWFRHSQGGIQEEAPSPAHADALEALRGTLREQAVTAADAMLVSAWQAAVQIAEERAQAELGQLRVDVGTRDQTIGGLEEALEEADQTKADLVRARDQLSVDLASVTSTLQQAEQAAARDAERIRDLEKSLGEANESIQVARNGLTAARVQAEAAIEERDRVIRERDVERTARQQDAQVISGLRADLDHGHSKQAAAEATVVALREELARLRDDRAGDHDVFKELRADLARVQGAHAVLDSRTTGALEQVEHLSRDLLAERAARETIQGDLVRTLAGKASAEAAIEAVRAEAVRIREQLADERAGHDALVERAVAAEAEVRRLDAERAAKTAQASG